MLKIKRLLAATAVVSFVFTAAACSRSNEPSEKASSQTQTQDSEDNTKTTLKVGDVNGSARDEDFCNQLADFANALDQEPVFTESFDEAALETAMREMFTDLLTSINELVPNAPNSEVENALADMKESLEKYLGQPLSAFAYGSDPEATQKLDAASRVLERYGVEVCDFDPNWGETGNAPDGNSSLTTVYDEE